MMISNFLFLVAILAVAYQLTPSILQPVLWKDPNPLPSLTGSLAPNTLLTHIRKVSHDFSGPESIVFDPVTGQAYASVSDGSVIRLSAQGEYEARCSLLEGICRDRDNNKKRMSCFNIVIEKH
jgi:hypothetical protein